ncbi:Gag-Pol polyprotein, partial [Schistosoma japonicum]
SKGACFVCLKRGHRASECKSTKRCNVEECSKRHHYLLHSNQQSHCGYTMSLGHHVCLGIKPIWLRSENAKVVRYAFLDNGSDATLIHSDCLKSLGLKEEQVSIVLQTVGGNKTAKDTNTSFEVHSLNQTEHIEINGALVVERIPGRNPERCMLDVVQKWPHLADVPLDSIDSDEVLLLIDFVNHTFMRCSSKDQLRRLYDMEFANVYSNDKAVSLDNLNAIKIVEEGTYFANGHFFVPIPWRNNVDITKDNYEMAKCRLHSLKRKMLRDY